MKKLETRIAAEVAALGTRPLKIRELAKKMQIPAAEYVEFRRTVKGMMKSGKLNRQRGGRVGGQRKAEATVVGRLSVTKSGRAFVQPEGDKEEIVIEEWGLGTALHGDQVEVRMLPAAKRARPAGEIVKVLERATTEVVGKFYQSRFHTFVLPDDPRLKIEIRVEPPKGTPLRDGTKVVVHLEEWTNERDIPRGKILHVLGLPGEKDVDVLSTIYKFKLPTAFPAAVMSEAAVIAEEIPAEEIARRLDLRKTTTFTIDPEDAKDHDDAVSVERLGEGYRLGVHIADVSQYVESGTKLDKEARGRTASAYLVDRVLPMLPEKLSNNLCSLKEKLDRLAMSVLIDLDVAGNVKKYKIHESVIRSCAKLSYEQVQETLDGGAGLDKQKRVVQAIRVMHELALKLIDRRRRQGSIDFDLPEYKVFLDDYGIVTKIVKRERKMSHRIIEEFMLLANRLVAQEMLGRTVPALYRVHPPPDEEKLANFVEFARSFGHRASFGSPPQPKHIAEFIESIEGRPEADLLNELLVRSMQKATYQTENIGHFGLAFPHYLHFTSPIRRYPDLIVHRTLKEVLRGTFKKSKAGGLKAALDRIGEHCSQQEIVIMEAERETIAIKQAEFLSRQLGEVFNGVISGMLSFGFFVRLLDIGAEGMVRLATLEDDYYHVELERHEIIGKRTQRRMRLGDKVQVQVINVAVESGQIDFRLIQDQAKPRLQAYSYRNRRRWR
ncbi:MAG: ribonuclease R [candidate division Zixibacteria bacterium]|nr:ribonuclease R [candidate division Zixibacteria bacterium]